MHNRIKFNKNLLRAFCLATSARFWDKYGTRYTVNSGGRHYDRATLKYVANGDDYYWYKDNGSNVLAVAHTDTFYPSNDYKYSGKTGVVVSGALDDRLGAYVILDILPRLGIVMDVLLTTGEECMQTTAKYFTPPKGKKYNWVVSFDRRGADVVMYQYENDDLTDRLISAGFLPDFGSYSDIAELEHLDCSCFNVGIGYHSEHRAFCNANLGETAGQIHRFVKFYDMYKNVYIKQDLQYDNFYSGGYGFGRGGVYDSDYYAKPYKLLTDTVPINTTAANNYVPDKNRTKYGYALCENCMEPDNLATCSVYDSYGNVAFCVCVDCADYYNKCNNCEGLFCDELSADGYCQLCAYEYDEKEPKLRKHKSINGQSIG